MLGHWFCVGVVITVLLPILGDGRISSLSAVDNMMEDCVFCTGPLTALPTVKLRSKGCESINSASAERNADIHVKPGQEVHVECRRNFIHKRRAPTDNDFNNNSVKTCATRSSNVFDFKNKCLFCSNDVQLNNKKRAIDVFSVRTIDFQENIKQICSKRNDEWAQDVSDRISQVIDLPAADAVYHQSCSVNFRTCQQIPKKFAQDEFSPNRKCRGRPESTDTSEAFRSVIDHIIDNEGSVLSMTELIRLMEDTCGDRAYSYKHMKNKLIDYFGDSISITTAGNTETKVTLKRTASAIINDFSKNGQGLSENEKKMSIIAAAGKLIKADINAIQTEVAKKFYPSFTSVSSSSENKEFVPESLQYLLTSLLIGTDIDKKLASIGQAIVQAARPKSILAPLQIGLGVQLHHQFGSRYLVDLLNTLGFSSSYYEVQRFESNAASTLNTTIPSFLPGKFLQFVADNADHNSCTVDGHRTFHGMGIIACTSPGSNVSLPIPRNVVSVRELSEIGKIKIKFFKYPDDRIQEKVVFQDLQDRALQETSTDQLDVFCKIIWPLNTSRPSWSGFMQMYSTPENPHPNKSSVTFLPMIDMSPSDPSCINTTLHFVTEQSKRYGVTPVLTFDQPLFQKATQIINLSERTSPLRTIVLRLGGFHTEMSFLGTIGYIMSGSGLEDVLQTIYAPNAVTHMLSGKAVSRAVRGHYLVDTALHTLLLSKVFPNDIPPALLYTGNLETGIYPESRLMSGISQCDIPNAQEDGHNFMEHTSVETIDNEQHRELLHSNDPLQITEECAEYTVCADQPSGVLAGLSEIYDKLVKKQISKREVCEDGNLKIASQKINDEKEKLQGNRTAALWCQYIHMVEILQQFIRAERTGDWLGHLSSLRKMLPYFAASGHYLYLKSAHIYLQNMMNLENDHPDVYRQFLNGNHSVRRTDKYWGGLSTDLIIEQVLMRSMKSTGGLTRGRGLSEAQRTLWLLSMPACAEMNHAMQEYSDTNYATSEQHQDTSVSRCKRDEHDVVKVLHFLQGRSPFEEADMSLRNIETGVTADEKVNVDMALDVGEKILKNMEGQFIDEYVYKRKCQVVPLSDKSSIKINDETVSIDPQLLFQRLITVADRCDEDIGSIFKYELSSQPSALFDNTGLPRAAQKSQLADAIWKLGDSNPEMQTVPEMYVIDGGSLLQKIPWRKNDTFGAVCEQYYQYLTHKYTNTTVIFDGYSNGPSTKDITHVRRHMTTMGTPVRFTYDTPFRSSKDSFLKNPENKQNFINLLGGYLDERGVNVKHAENDADLLIVCTAVEFAETQTTIAIGEDTDLLVLLCYLAKRDSMKIYFRSDTRQFKSKVNKVWDIHKTQSVLTRPVCDLLPLLHALTGCDTTSRIFGIGKSSALKCLRMNLQFQELCKSIMESSTKEEVIQYGEMAVVLLMEGDASQSIDTMRFQRFNAKVMTSTHCVQIHTLPPTSAATVFHSLRVFYQTQVWIGNSNLKPEEWGWQLKNGMYSPIKTDRPAAPQNLLNIVRCNCKTNCDSKRCTCRKNGLDCSYGCGSCRGISCTNTVQIEILQGNL